MDTPSRRKRRNRLVGRAAATTRPAPDSAPGDQAVAAAQDIVSGAWIQVLVEHRDLRQAEAQAADARCDVARRTLAAALVERRPGQMAAAHADLEEALGAARTAGDLYAHVHQGLA